MRPYSRAWDESGFIFRPDVTDPTTVRPDAFRRRGNRGRGVLLWTLATSLLAALPIGFANPASRTTSEQGGSISEGLTVVATSFTPRSGTVDLGAVPPSAPMTVAIAVDPSRLSSLGPVATLEYTPGSPLYHQFLTPHEIAVRFGAPEPTRRSVQGYFGPFGLDVAFSPDGLLATVSGNASSVARAFHTSFETFESGGRRFFSHTTPAELPSGIPWYGALGLGNVTEIRPLARLSSPPPAGTSPSAGCAASYFLTPCQIWTAYNESPLLKAGTNGSGFRLGVVDAYDGTEPQSQLAADLRAFAKNNSLAVNPVRFLYPVPTTKNLNTTSTGWGLEESLDIEWSRAMAPGATIDMTFAPDAGVGLYAAVDWLVAHHAVDVLSLSWGEPDVGVYNSYAGPCSIGCNASTDGSYLLLHPVLEAAAAEGIGVFAATGDCGAAYGTNGVSTGYPSSDPFAVGVGGTDLTLNASNGWAAETAWSGNASGSASPGCQNQGGSGGGFSPFPRPAWQAAPGLPTSPTTRGIPDVSISGGTAVSIVYSGFSTGASGTSESSPIWAGIATVADQASGMPLGDLGPSLYAVARGPFANRSFHDILRGSNGYSAHSGWDPVTGLGSPNVGSLLPRLAVARPSASPAVVTLHATPRFAPVGTTVTFYLNVTGDPRPVAWSDVSFGDGNASTVASAKVSHQFPSMGVFEAEAVAFDTAGNSSVSPPIAIVIGGGTALNVTLAVNDSTPAIGAPVAFTVTVTGSPGPFLFNYAFGDGTSQNNATQFTLNHTFGARLATCAAVIVRTTTARPDGAVTNQVALTVGGAVARTCEAGSAVSARLTSVAVAADLPGDLPLTVTESGGVAPYSVQFVTDDAYVRACTCGIFTRAGNHTVTAYVNDSLTDGAVVQLNVTMYPALRGAFTASVTSGTAPLRVTFNATSLGGHLASAANTFWSFGDGSNTTGASVVHTFAAGTYTAVADLSDAGGGNSSAAFVVHAFTGTTPGLFVNASIVPAVRVPAGTLVNFTALASGGTAPYQFVWTLGDNDSAFGPSVQQTYSRLGCIGAGTCPLVVRVNVTDAAGHRANATFALGTPIVGLASAISFTDSFGPLAGVTPLLVNGSTSVSPVPPSRLVWNMGDGGNTTGASIAYRYLSPGNFTAVETVTSAVGDRLIRSHAVVVRGPVRTVPTVSGGPLVANGTAPFPVHFSATAAGGAGAPYSYSWSFGDGGSATGPNVWHLYLNAGQYTARVTAADHLGVPVSATYSITVYELVPLIFLNLTVPTYALPAGGPVVTRIQAEVICGKLAPPGCSAANASTGFEFVPTGSTLPSNGSGATPLPSFTRLGYLNTTLTAPTHAGVYQLFLTTTGSAYSGNDTATLTIVAVCGCPNHPARPANPSAILLVALTAGVVIGAAAWWTVRRRERSRPEPSNDGTAPDDETTPLPPRGEEAGPPGG